ncbi:PIN domain-containing protein [Xanthomonas hortorum]|uniref:Toxin FitB n=1 Tax=Xanthomonas hortorum pv. carotae TaxID=487904 RepID=A0A6V7FMY3_9XANT|nr:PIN domain-containing protein [Xanthomonas hortorum]ETC83445.1 plasmid stability protein [Xanthomonas hortorum pv. carotae str. M081]CAD0364678.1 Toxin FitB [Xanthomonas hortorum pv. carotae]CAD0364679.1 Toxin FitB [Xanthomonas hortorum pv. carotae]
MILLDTNVISELWRPRPNPQVVAWIDAQAVETLFLSVVTVAELRFGIAVMPQGRKRSTLHARLESDVLPLFDGRLLAFGLDASHAFATLASKARTAGLTRAHRCLHRCNGSRARLGRCHSRHGTLRGDGVGRH